MLKFGTSGVRGLVSEFTENNVRLLTRAFLMHAQNIGQTSNVAFACDFRNSSPAIQDFAIKAVHEFSRDAYCCGIIPTPALALFVQQNKCLGMMITGSHIPADRNGIKFYLESGETTKSDDQAIFKIYENLKAKSVTSPSNIAGKTIESSQKAKQAYTDRYLKLFPANILAGYKILFYQHSSAARDLFPEILESLGATVTRIGFSETFVPVDTEAVEALDKFGEWIQQYNADIFISTDGDADRPLVLDEKGGLIPGDKLGALTSIYLGCEAIAMPISCNSGILQNKSFQKIVQTKIGSPFVIEALERLAQEFSSVAGFEANGGYILQSDMNIHGRHLQKLPTRDAVLPVLCAMALAKEKSLKISDLAMLLPKVYTASGLLKNYASERSSSTLKMVAEDPSSFFTKTLKDWNLSLVDVNNLDGLRFEFKDHFIIHLRPSGNAPEFRCYTEAPTPKQADILCKEVLSALESL